MKLGAFELLRPLGRGGMGEVWAARHRDGWPVAVKILTTESARVPELRYALQAEVRALAGLDHRAIVQVYEQGQVEQARRSLDGPDLRIGSPYFVMERGVGTLLAVLGQLDWTSLRETLLTMLDALAHAHARFILHRDLKPSNLIRMQDGSIRLTDFGLAFPMGMGSRPEASRTAGTPAFMSPEQVLGEWRDWGPWTDLYAFGCLAWALASGEPPFVSNVPGEVYDMHLRDELKPLRTAQPVGEGFEAWLRRLLEKRPEDRFQCAADAAQAFQSSVAARITTRSRPISELPSGGLPMERSVARLPRTWRVAEAERSAIPVGVGLGLHGLRSLRLVGREMERDALWKLLRSVHGFRQPRIALVRGTSGSGKTRLAQWLGERAYELGAARHLRAIHGPVQSGEDGLFACARRELAGWELPDDERVRHVRRWAQRRGGAPSAVELERLAALASRAPWSELGSDEDRTAAMATFLDRMSHDRPLVMVCDDVQWGIDSFEIVRSIWRSQTLPLLFLLTARDESLDSAMARRLDEIADLQLELGPLSDDEQLALVQQQLGLDDELAAEVNQRSGGNPLFAVQLIGDLVQRRALVESARGFVRRADARRDIPDDLHSLWMARCEFAFQGSEGAAIAAEVAAVLGRRVDWDEFVAAAGVGVEPARELVSRLADAQLAVIHHDGFELVHGLLRESLQRCAREAGRWRAHNRKVANVLQARGAPAWRLGLHFLEAGQHADAAEHLLEGASQLLESASIRRALILIEAFGRAADQAGIRDDTRRRARAALIGAECRLNDDAYDALRLCEGLQKRAKDQGWPEIEAESLRVMGGALARVGRLAESVTAYRQALTVGARAEHWEKSATCHHWLGMSLRLLGEYERATETLEIAMELSEHTEDRGEGAASRIGLALVALDANHLEEARRWALQGLERAGESKYAKTRTHAFAYNALGEIARAMGDLEGARRAYEKGLGHLRGTGFVGEATMEGNLGHTQLAAGEYQEAKELLDRAARWSKDAGHSRLAVDFVAGLAAACAGLREWDAVLLHTAELEALAETAPVASRDLAICARQAAELCHVAGQERLALRLVELSRATFASMGRDSDVADAESLRHLIAGRIDRLS